MKLSLIIILLGAFYLLVSIECQAQDLQDTTKMYNVETFDGNEFVGRIISRTPDKITLLTEDFGEINIPLRNIKRIQEVSRSRMIQGKYWFENPQATRYFWAPNGYGLKKGEGYYQNVWIFFNQFAGGVTDYFSIGAGIVPAFIFAGSATPVWITPKFSIPAVKDKLNVGFGALAGAVIGEEGATFGILYGSTTFGSKDKNLSLGLGYGFAGGEWSSGPAINLSTMIRVSQRAYFISENYYIGLGGSDAGVISFGGRSIIKRISLDYGGFLPIGSGEFIIIPWLGLTIPFGKQQDVSLGY